MHITDEQCIHLPTRRFRPIASTPDRSLAVAATAGFSCGLGALALLCCACAAHTGEGASSGEEPPRIGVAEEALAAPVPIFEATCNASQQDKVLSAMAVARIMASRASAAMQNTTTADRPASGWYSSWFGSYDAGRWATVASNLQKISTTLTTGQYTFACDCVNPVASTDTGTKYHMHLCNEFFNYRVTGSERPVTGFGGKAGVLVHETSHFLAVAGTDDHGTQCSLSQATTDANCYESFAEGGFGTGFMIMSDSNSGLAMNALGRAREGANVGLSSICAVTNPDCRWTYRGGMILSDTDPALAVNAWGGARDGAAVLLTKLCTPTNPDCTWTYSHGVLFSDNGTGLAITPYGGAGDGRSLVVTAACNATNPNCTWTFKNLMITSTFNPQLAANALGGAVHGANVGPHIACGQGNPDCTWAYSHGMFVSDRDPSLAINAWGGAQLGQFLRLHNACNSANPDCTWSIKRGLIMSDRNNSLTITTFAGDHSGGFFALTNRCPTCTYGFDKIN
jgi:hypothetical protein